MSERALSLIDHLERLVSSKLVKRDFSCGKWRYEDEDGCGMWSPFQGFTQTIGDGPNAITHRHPGPICGNTKAEAEEALRHDLLGWLGQLRSELEGGES